MTTWHDRDIGCDDGLADEPEPVTECDLHGPREATAQCRVCHAPGCDECLTRCIGPGREHWFHAASEKCGFIDSRNNNEPWCFECHAANLQDLGNMVTERTMEMLSRRQKQMLKEAVEAGGYELRTRTDGPDCQVVLMNNTGMPRPDGMPHLEVVAKCGKRDFVPLHAAVQLEWDRLLAAREHAHVA